MNLTAEAVEFILTDELRFIDPGVNFENVSCPICSNIMDLDWWGEAMDKASEKSFRNLSVVTDCCNASTSLEEMIYKGNAGFARFSIEILNPDNEITEETIANLGQMLGCSMLKVEAYY